MAKKKQNKKRGSRRKVYSKPKQDPNKVGFDSLDSLTVVSE